MFLCYDARMPFDIGAGILIALGLGYIYPPENFALWVLLGVFFALLPDFDALINAVQYRGLDHEYSHRDLLHLPLLYTPIGTLCIYVFSPHVALLFALCSFAHFVHDSIGIGWGVQWLSPINTDHFSVLYLYQPPGKPALRKKYFYRFAHADIDALDRVHGDPDWIRHIYREMHPFAIVEFLVLAAGIALLCIYGL